MRTYVIQIAAGREQQMLRRIQRVTADEPRTTCYCPRFAYQKKVKGTWELEEKPLTPGYLYVETPDPQNFEKLLQQIAGYAHLLRMNGQIVPLSTEEVAWLSVLTGENHVVEPSFGIMVGDRVTIVDGPLKGLESNIVKFDRHKRFAYVDIQLLGRTTTIKVGAEIVRKVDELGG